MKTLRHPFTLCLAMFTLFGSVPAMASGSYATRPPVPGTTSESTDRAKYSLGQRIFTGDIAPDAEADADAQKVRLAQMQNVLPSRFADEKDLTLLAGRLTSEQIDALGYYVDRRYGTADRPSSGGPQSASLPPKGQIVVSPGFSFTTFDEFWVGKNRVGPLKANDESLDQFTGFLSLEYGITDDLAADLTIGYTETSSTATFGNDSDGGLADTSIGLRYRLLRETEVLPAVAVRVGGILAGTYDENTPFSAGDGADAVEVSLLAGKAFGDSGFGVYGDIGYRLRESPVPDDLFGSAGVYKQFSGLFHDRDAVSVSVGYRHVQSLSGLDIMGAGWDPPAGASSGFPALKEVNQLFEGAIGYTDAGGRQYQFTAAKSLDGRNTGDKLAFYFNVSLPFGGR